MTGHKLWYTAPASAWTHALPVGNGRLGAMVFGGTGRERLQLNEDTLWAGGPYDPTNPAALRAWSRGDNSFSGMDSMFFVAASILSVGIAAMPP